MLKKSLFAIALLGLLASMAMAGDEVIWRKEGCTWRYSHCFKARDICKIPVFLKVGYYIKLDKCGDRKIIMNPMGVDYVGCTDFTISSNFTMVIGARIEVLQAGKDIQGDLGKWEAYIDGGGIVRQKGGKTEGHKICAKVKEPTMIAMMDPGDHSEVQVAHAFITVRPVCRAGGTDDGFEESGGGSSNLEP